MGVFFMDDKNEQIYSQYQLEILSIYKVRGLIYLETQQGFTSCILRSHTGVPYCYYT